MIYPFKLTKSAFRQIPRSFFPYFFEKTVSESRVKLLGYINYFPDVDWKTQGRALNILYEWNGQLYRTTLAPFDADIIDGVLSEPTSINSVLDHYAEVEKLPQIFLGG